MLLEESARRLTEIMSFHLQHIVQQSQLGNLHVYVRIRVSGAEVLAVNS